MAVDVNDLLTNLKQSSGAQYGADNGYSPFSHLIGGNVGTISDTLTDDTAITTAPVDILYTSKWFSSLSGSSGLRYAPYYRKEGIKFSLKDGKRYCLVQYRIYHGYKADPYSGSIERGKYMYGYVLLSNDNTLKHKYYFGYTYYGFIDKDSTPEIITAAKHVQDMNSISDETIAPHYSFDSFYASVRTNDRVSLESKTYFEALNNSMIGLKSDLNAYYGHSSDEPLRFDGSINSSDNILKSTSVNRVSSQIPVFDISNYQNIVRYLIDGEIVNPEDSGNLSPETDTVDAGFMLPNYATTWDIYLTAGDGNGRIVITSSCAMAEELGAEPKKKVKTVYSVDPKTSYLFDSKYRYQEKQYSNAFSVNLSDIARNEGGNAWLDSNNDPKGNHTLYGMLYTGGGNSIAFSFQWFFEPTSNIGVEIVSGNAVKFWKAAESPVGSFVIQSTSVEQTATGWKYIDLYGDIVNLHINESYTEENDVYSPDRGNQYNPQTDVYGASSGFIPQRGGAYYTYKLTYQELKNVVSQFTGVTWTSVLASIFGGDLWKCLKSLKYTPIAYNGAVTKSKLLLGGGTTQVGNADYDYINATYVTPCGTISNISRKYNNFLDYNPYTQFILHLPFTGYVDLPVDEIYNCTLKFELAVDYITGEGLWLISRNGCIRWTYTCNVAANIPLDGYSSADFTQSVMGHIGISGIASASLSTPVQIRDKQMKMETRSGYLNALDSMSIFYILEYPKAQLPTSAPHDVGRPCGLTKTLSSLKGFTKCKNVDVSGYSCTDAERNELISLLESGIYL